MADEPLGEALLLEATRALREVGDRDEAPAAATRARLLASLDARPVRRRSRWLRWPAFGAGLLGAAVAWAAATGHVEAVVEVLRGEEAATVGEIARTSAVGRGATPIPIPIPIPIPMPVS